MVVLWRFASLRVGGRQVLLENKHEDFHRFSPCPICFSLYSSITGVRAPIDRRLIVDRSRSTIMIAERERSSLKQFLLLFKILMALTSKIFFLARSAGSVDLPDPRYSNFYSKINRYD